MRKILHFLLLYSAMCGAPTQAGAASIGIVTAVKGPRSQTGGTIALMDQIQEAGVLRLAAGGEVVVFLYAGAREYTLTGPGVFALGSHGVARTSATGSVAMKRMDPLFGAIATPRAGLVQAGATVRSSADPVDDTSASCEAIDPAQPVFRWPARSHIGNYEVMLTDANGQVLYRTEAVDNQATPPDALRLAPGAEFRLELTWREPGGNCAYAATTFGRSTHTMLRRLHDCAPMPRHHRRPKCCSACGCVRLVPGRRPNPT